MTASDNFGPYKWVTRFWFAVAVFALTYPIQVTAAVTVTLLPGLGPDAWFHEDAIEQTGAFGLNNAGVVVGATNSNPHLSGEGEAVHWIVGEIGILPRLPDALPNGLNFNAADINDDDVIVGFSAFPTPQKQTAFHATKWVGGLPTDLGTLPDHDSSSAGAINNAGHIAGTSETGGYFGTQTAVRWQPDGQIFPLDLLPTQDASFIDQGLLEHDRGTPGDINAAGRIVGYSELFGGDFPFERLPVYWDNVSATALPLPGGYNSGQALGINDAGEIVGDIAVLDRDSFSFTSHRAVVWNDTSSEPELLPLPPDADFSYATAVNALGQVIGGTAGDGDSASYGFGSSLLLWNPDGSMVDLTPYLVAAFPRETSFRLTDINDHGQITGYTRGSMEADLDGFAFVLTIPEPATSVLLLGVAIGWIALRRHACDSSCAPEERCQ